jgi:hypothetical protein
VPLPDESPTAEVRVVESVCGECKVFVDKYLGDGLDGPDLGDVSLEVALDADLEGDGAGGAAHARPVKADADGAVGGDLD